MLLSIYVIGNAVIKLWMAALHGSLRKVRENRAQVFFFFLVFSLLHCFLSGPYNKLVHLCQSSQIHFLFVFYSYPFFFFPLWTRFLTWKQCRLISTWPQRTESLLLTPSQTFWVISEIMWLLRDYSRKNTSATHPSHAYHPCTVIVLQHRRLKGSVQGVLSLGRLLQMQMSAGYFQSFCLVRLKNLQFW